MTDTASSATGSVAGGCPFHSARVLPTDGTPLTPSPTIARWREEAPATPLHYTDGHEGWVVTGYDLARSVLEDARFSQVPERMPAATKPFVAAEDPLDDAAVAAMAANNLLSIDAPRHGELRRAITSRFSVRAVRGHREAVQRIVADQLEHLRGQGSPADLTRHFSERVSTLIHAHVLGIPEEQVGEFVALFMHESPVQQKYDFARGIVAGKAEAPADDVLGDLAASDLPRDTVEAVAFELMSSGRDSVAYLISTATVALLTHPEQLVRLRDDPALLPGAIEEFMRVGAMFLTLFPRTATEEVVIDGFTFAAGDSVSVSPVGANHDAARFDDPDTFDIERDAYGHLGFGHGLHSCVGQQLARVEIGEAITQLLAGLPGLALVDAEQLRPGPFAHPVATYRAGEVLVSWE